MKRRLLIEPEAEADLQPTYAWYEQRSGLGDDFLLCFEAAAEAIAERPGSFPSVARNARRALMPRFPYLIVFSELRDVISILAVLHASRDPEHWRRRLRRRQGTKRMASHVQIEIRALANPAQAANLQRFFKTGPGEYGEGDRFLGLKVPQVRQVTRAHRDLPLGEVARLLKSKYHEERLAALLILILKFEKADEPLRKRIYELYLRSTRFINNWDLVDVSAPRIVGAYLADKDQAILFNLAQSPLLWERRIAVLATLYFISKNEFAPTLKLAQMLLADREDLIHKAVGWMLREVGKRDRSAEESFLDKHSAHMPRTMLRYAIERFPTQQRQSYLNRGRLNRSTRA